MTTIQSLRFDGLLSFAPGSPAFGLGALNVLIGANGSGKSNVVTGAIIMPILIALAQDLGLDVWTIAAPAAFTSTLAFILVTESPTNVLPYSAGYFSIRDMAKVGVVMTVGAAACVTIAVVAVRAVVG